MKVFTFDTLGNLHDPELVVLDGGPVGMGVAYARLVRGRPAADKYPADAVVRMDPERPGLKLASLIGNTNRYLIVHRALEAVIRSEHEARGSTAVLEAFPFTLLDHRGRPRSSDYLFLNPLSFVDAVDDARSDIEYFKGDRTRVVGVNKLVLDAAKLVGAPPLFRVPQTPDRYYVDEALHARITAGDFTNVSFVEVEVGGRDAHGA